MKLKKETFLELYTTMLKIRLFEDRIVDLYARGEVPGLAHLYIGEEAVAAGVCASLRCRAGSTATGSSESERIPEGCT